jgi:hypothetical protein
MTQDYVDLDLVAKTIDLIPDHCWEQVKQSIVTCLVDNMPGSIIQKLTGSYTDFDNAEAILFNYYELPDCKEELITDAFKIIGLVNSLELLNSLNLSKEDGVPETQAT